jgi:hypothetical protein
MITELTRAEDLAAAGDLAEGRAIADAVIARDPEQPRAHNILGFIAHAEGRLDVAERELSLACSMAGADEDMRENLEAVRRDADDAAQAHDASAALVNRALAELDAEREGGAATSSIELDFEADVARDLTPPPAPDFTGTLGELHAGAFGPGLSARLLGALLGSALEPRVLARLSELPSATSVRERGFLVRFTARFWDGEQDVFENGPLLGGTTRALALGMLANPKRTPGALLHTHDWFSSRVKLDVHPQAFQHMIARGQISQGQHDDMIASGSFQRVFEHLHTGQDYSQLVRTHEAYLPGRRGDVPAHGEAIFAPPPDGTFGLVFIDGCKSWYGTKHWIGRMCEQIPSGSRFVFQDYGWYTCFWLPTLIGVLPEHFRLVAHVDDTYAFELLKPITPADIDARFPDTPAELGREAFAALFARLLGDAGRRSDAHSTIALTIQHAGALATIGFKDEARSRIAALLERPENHWYSGIIQEALASPTYTPEGEVTL